MLKGGGGGGRGLGGGGGESVVTADCDYSVFTSANMKVY